jgi:uncharacterized protein
MDRADRDHTTCAQLFTSNREPMVIPSPVLVELDWLASSRLGPAAFLSMLTDIHTGAARVVGLTRDDYQRVRQLCQDFADLRLGFVDAAVLAIVERLGERKLATLDHRHFRILRPAHTPSLLLLPLVDPD